MSLRVTRRVLIALAAVVLVGGVVPRAFGADYTYPFATLFDMSNAQDWQDTRQDTYTGQAGFVNVPARVARNVQSWTAEGPKALGDGVIDATTHSRPTLLGSNVAIIGDTYLMPDWNHDNVFGDVGDYDVDNSDALVSAPFLLPCISLEHVISYETTSGSCARSGSLKVGTARRIHVVNSRGRKIMATLWVPPGLDGPTPGVVFADGFLSRQTDYYAYPMTAARGGFIALSFDESGQGQSEGTGFELSYADATGDCKVPGPCRDLQEMVRWFVNEPIARTTKKLPRLSALGDQRYVPLGDNIHNPALSLLDTSHIGIYGQSMGSLSTIGYLQAAVHNERDALRQLLPKVSAAVALSGFTKLNRVDVPLQIQTDDYDIPGYNASNGIDATDGPLGAKDWYDTRRGLAQLSMILTESGSHLDESNATYSNRAPWTLALSTSYAVDHFRCFLAGDASACTSSVTKRPHLSRIAASEYDPDGRSGHGRSRCISVPDKGSIAQVYHPLVMVQSIQGNPPYDCAR